MPKSILEIAQRVQGEQQALERLGGVSIGPDGAAYDDDGNPVAGLQYTRVYAGELTDEDSLILGVRTPAMPEADYPLTDLYFWLAAIAAGIARGTLTVTATWSAMDAAVE